ncbi:hypothetical protein ACQEUX_06045 [Micromonospora sp. CA-259024]|uniref:hypothetical protein n=1 Tax=Micromonospora sp. CA-259024 TaxID=3239965 RepID=UPI003D9189F0
MATGRASKLSTRQGYYWHALLLGDHSLARRLRSGALLDKKALAAVLEGMFVVMVGWLRPDPLCPMEIHRFAERVTERIHAEHGVTADEVSRLIHRELGDATGDADITPAHRVVAQLAVITTALGGLGLMPGNIDRMISEAEGLVRQWGLDLPAYRPGFLLRWRFELAEARWYGSSARNRWKVERAGAFVSWLDPGSSTP